MELGNRAKNITPSATVELTAKITEMRRKGTEVISFSAGEPDFDSPDNVLKAAKEAIDNGKTRYTSSSGIAPLKDAICSKLKEENGLDYSADQVIVTTGAKQALFNALQVLCNPGDEVLIPVPCYVSYVEMVKLAGARPVFVPTSSESSYQLDVSKVKAALSPSTKAIIINSPNNPTGAVYSKEVLTELGKLSAETGLIIISDEVYEKLVYGDCKHYSVASLVPECKKNTVVINSVSKTYAMTGWRVGYAASETNVIKAMNSIIGHQTSSVCTPAQYAALEALTGPQNYVEVMVKEFEKRRNYIVERFNSIPGVCCPEPSGAFYVMPTISSVFGKFYHGRKISDSKDFALVLLEEEHIAVVPGIAFEAPETIRMVYANSIEEIKEGMDKIEKVFSSIRSCT